MYIADHDKAVLLERGGGVLIGNRVGLVFYDNERWWRELI